MDEFLHFFSRPFAWQFENFKLPGVNRLVYSPIWLINASDRTLPTFSLVVILLVVVVAATFSPASVIIRVVIITAAVSSTTVIVGVVIDVGIVISTIVAVVVVIQVG
ncbi:MAG: hypothetical protein IH586_02960, partial [Anaerolineaceae bacterium]|nr:hypothetical protein [Anaerolineaceae bacterium]